MAQRDYQMTLEYKVPDYRKHIDPVAINIWDMMNITQKEYIDRYCSVDGAPPKELLPLCIVVGTINNEPPKK